jgi:hypothetical protein
MSFIPSPGCTRWKRPEARRFQRLCADDCGLFTAELQGAVAIRMIQPPSAGKILAFPEVGGLHHRYERRAA